MIPPASPRSSSSLFLLGAVALISSNTWSSRYSLSWLPRAAVALGFAPPTLPISAQVVGRGRRRGSHRMHRRLNIFAMMTGNVGEDDGESGAAAAEADDDSSDGKKRKRRKVVIVGAGWGGLSAAQSLSSSHECDVTLVDASPRVGGVVRDGFTSISGNRPAEAGQHGFWDNYLNIFEFLEKDLPGVDMDDILTGYAEQGQYSPGGLEAVWPVYRDKSPRLPTGLAQAFYTRFEGLSKADLLTAFPLVAAFNDFDDSEEAWRKYDKTSFRDLCTRLGVSRKCYDEAFEPMILTGLFAPGSECSAAAALGMAYFFVLKSQNSFDVRWCRGNIGEKIFDPWVKNLEKRGVTLLTSTRVTGFEMNDDGDPGKTERISKVICSSDSNGDKKTIKLDADAVVFAVGASALSAMVTNVSDLSRHAEFRRYANLRGTSVLATRIYMDKTINIPYSANACWGFDEGVGMTVFDISTLHGTENEEEVGSVIEVDYYHASSLLVMNDDDIVAKVKSDLDTMLGRECIESNVVDAAVVRLPRGVNWYFPGSYADMPSVQSDSISNAYFAGDLVRSRHGSWSQEKAFVTGIEASNAILDRPLSEGVISLQPDEPHVALGRRTASFMKDRGLPSLADFLW